MRKVWKQNLDLIDEPQKISMPDGSLVVHVDRQNDWSVTIWYEVDAEETTMVDRWFTVEGTGHPLPELGRYVGTAVVPIGLVWHVYEVPEPC